MMKNKFEIGEKVLIINPGHNYPSDVFAQRLFSDKLEYFQGISIGGYGRVNNMLQYIILRKMFLK